MAEEDNAPSKFQQLPDELLRVIFLLLPVSTIGGMRRLCSSFRACIRKRDFATAYINGHKADSCECEEGTPIIRIERSVPGYISCMRELYFPSDGVTLTQSTIANIPVRGFDLKVAGTANGLVLLQKIKGYPYSLNPWASSQLVIWNPVLGNRFFIRRSPLQFFLKKLRPDQIWHWRLDELQANVGFRYDSQTKDYEVVVIVMDSGLGLLHLRSWVEVYKVRTGTWQTKFLAYFDPGYAWGPKVCHGRSIYWTLHFNSPHYFWKHYRLVSFNLDTCSGNSIEVPYHFTDGTEVKFPVLHNGSLAVFSVHRLYTMIHVLEENGWLKEWEQHLRFLSPQRERFIAFLKSGRISNAIFFPEQKCILISLYGCGLLSYNFLTNELRFMDDATTFLDTYMMSLVRLPLR